VPELPEVETMRRGVLPVVGARVTGVCRLESRLRPITVWPGISAFAQRVVGTRVEHVDRLGKRLLVWLDTDQAVVFEPRMTGLVLLADPPSHEHLRLRVDLRGTRVPHLWYWDRRGLGSVRLLSRRQVEQRLGPPRLGPDALGLDAERLQVRLARRRAPIKVA
jgi:formamidopyrimidine-DNA glycosylase